MPTRNVSLTPEQDAFIDDAIRALQGRKMDALHLERLRKSIDEGIADLDRGDYDEVDDAGLEIWLARVGDQARP